MIKALILLGSRHRWLAYKQVNVSDGRKYDSRMFLPEVLLSLLHVVACMLSKIMCMV